MDIELLVDIVNRGAGASKMFEIAAQSMLKNKKMSMEAVEGVGEMKNRLQLGLEKAKKIHQSMPMAAAALEQLIF